jgi:nicotinamidase-related amidase
LRQPPVLLVIDVQKGFRDQDYWGLSANPDVYSNVESLLKLWRSKSWPVVLVRHNSANPNSPLAPGGDGNALEEFLSGPNDAVIQKSVNSAFYGTPDLHLWLTKRNLRSVVICGITTNYCCETTARMAGNLGYKVQFAIDATTAFSVKLGDQEFTGSAVMAMTAANLDGEFAQVLKTSELVESYQNA